MRTTYNILVVGDFYSLIHEKAICKALKNKNHLVKEFRYSDILEQRNILSQKINNLQVKLGFGPSIYKINRKLLSEIEKNNYDLIFFYRPTFIKAWVLKKAREKSIVFFYNNDDPFSKEYKHNFWNNYLSGLKYCHHIFYYRKKNKIDLQMLGYQNISQLRSYFIKELNFPIRSLQNSKYICDVIFIGHYENDGRDEILKYLIDSNINIRIYGPEWKSSKYYEYFTSKIGKIYSLGEDYNLALNSTKIALVFFSRLNNDTYTRRCFEIPAAKTFMLSEFTQDMSSMFIERKEAEYFRSKEELKEKITFYLNNEENRIAIAQAGYEKVYSDKHEVNNRVDLIIEKLMICKQQYVI